MSYAYATIYTCSIRGLVAIRLRIGIEAKWGAIWTHSNLPRKMNERGRRSTKKKKNWNKIEKYRWKKMRPNLQYFPAVRGNDWNASLTIVLSLNSNSHVSHRCIWNGWFLACLVGWMVGWLTAWLVASLNVCVLHYSFACIIQAPKSVSSFPWPHSHTHAQTHTHTWTSLWVDDEMKEQNEPFEFEYSRMYSNFLFISFSFLFLLVTHIRIVYAPELDRCC